MHRARQFYPKVHRTSVTYYNCFIRWVLILSRASNQIDQISDAQCTGRQHSKKHSQTQLSLNEIGDLYKTEDGDVVYKEITFRLKARLVAGGHVLPLPLESAHSGVVSLRSVRLICFIAANDHAVESLCECLHLWMKKFQHVSPQTVFACWLLQSPAADSAAVVMHRTRQLVASELALI